MGKQWKHWLTLFLGGSKITADGDCSHEIKRRLLLGRKFNTIPITSTAGLYVDIYKLVLKFVWKCQNNFQVPKEF